MIEVSEDLLAITKLQSYVDNCTDMEMAKKICKSFLKKYDTQEPETGTLPISLGNHKYVIPDDYDYIHHMDTKDHKIVYQGQVVNLKTFGACTSIDTDDFEKYDKNAIKIRLTRTMINELAEEVYKSGFIYNSVEMDYPRNRYNIRFHLEVIDPKLLRPLPTKTLESL